MSMGDDVGSATMQIVKEVTPEVAKVLAKLFEINISLAKGTSKLLWEHTFKDKYEELQLEKEEIKNLEQIKRNSGFVGLDRFMAQNDEVSFCNLDEWVNSNEDITKIDKILKKYGIQCAFKREDIDIDGNGIKDLNIFYPTGKEQLFKEVLKDLYELKVTEMVMEQQFREEIKDNDIDFNYVDVINNEQKKQISNIVEQQFNKVNANNPNWDNEECFDDAWENASFENKSGKLLEIAGLKKKEQLIDKLGQHINKNDELLVIDGKVLYFKDQKEIHHVIDLHNKRYVQFNEEQLKQYCKEMGIEIDNPSQYLSKTIKEVNTTLKDQQYALESKYKEHSELQKVFIKETMFLEGKDSNIKLSQLDDAKLDIRSMLFLREAQKMKLDVTELLRNEYSAKQLQAFIKLKELESQVGSIEPQIYETFKDKTLTEYQIQAMLDKVLEEPNVSNDLLVETANQVVEQQKYVDNIIDGIEEKVGQRQDIDVSINEANEVAVINEISKSEVVKEIGLVNTDELHQIYNQLDTGYTDNNGTWKMYESENKFDYYINENNEIKVICLVEEVEKGIKLDESLKQPPVFEDGNSKWYEYSKLKNGKVIVNENGKAKMELNITRQKNIQLSKHKIKGVKEIGKKLKNIKGQEK